MIEYWRFYWPLALTGVAMVLSVQFQNATLARFPEAVRELAVFALAYGTFGFFRASLNFVSQLSNVYARSADAARRTWRFVTLASVVVVLPLILLGHTAPGADLLAVAYGISAEMTGRVTEYLRYLAPLVLLSAQRFHFTGLLVQARLTGWVTALNVLFLAAVVAGLFAGFQLGMRPVHVLVGAEGAAMVLHLAGTLWVTARLYRPPPEEGPASVSYRELLGFFVPVSLTGVMFALSRPVLYAFVSRTPEGVPAIAAMRVAFDFATMFQQAANQFRHFFVTFGLDDLATKRRFLTLVGVGLTGLMLLFAVTDLSLWLWRDLMAIPDDVRPLAVDVLLVMCLMPTVIILRNYHHGRLMVERRTTGMAVASVLRVIGIYLLGQALLAIGWLSHVTGAAVLIAGFGIEALVVLAASRQNGQGWREKATAKM